MTILVTGGAGFIGSNFVLVWLAQSDEPVVNLASLTYWIVRTFGLLKVRHYSLPNVLAGRELVPEISQDALTPQSLAAALTRWLDDPAAVATLQQEADAIHRRLRQDASARAADAVLEWLP